MDRERSIDEIASSDRVWDILIVGGGATGLGAALDAAARGYRTLLVERHDFAKGTSSRSTKLVHGGVRYLKQGDVSLVLEALEERGLLCRNAPHLVRNLAFVIPVYRWWDGPFYGIGMKVYDALAGRLGLRSSEILSLDETLERIPTVETRGLLRGVSYHDAQFDDSRLAVNLAQTVGDLGGVVANYVEVTALLKSNGLLSGAIAVDRETGAELRIAARAVVNATGVFCDAVRRMDEPGAPGVVAPSQGSHVVLPKSFLPGESAILVPHTEDGRVLFAVPWLDRVLVGTTDVPVDDSPLEPRPLDEEIEFLMTHAARYLRRDPGPADVLSVFAGLRPLVRAGDSKDTAALSRDHAILVSDSGLVTVTGGKWTTYRRMAEEVIDRTEMVLCEEHRPCTTANLRIHGWIPEGLPEGPLRGYGSDATSIARLAASEPGMADCVHPGVPVAAAQVAWAARHEMARTVEDVLARRTRVLLLDARSSVQAAPRVAAILAQELGRGAEWARASASAYRQVAERYVLPRHLA